MMRMSMNWWAVVMEEGEE
jgi:hypothetical protein